MTAGSPSTSTTTDHELVPSRAAAQVAGALIAIGVLVALITAATPLAEEGRDYFGPLDPTARDRLQVAELVANNIKLPAFALLVAALTAHAGQLTRTLSHTVLALAYTAQAVLIGFAAGAHGWDLLSEVAPHLTLELAALATPAGLLLSHRHHAPSITRLLTTTLATTLAVAGAAVLEVSV